MTLILIVLAVLAALCAIFGRSTVLLASAILTFVTGVLAILACLFVSMLTAKVITKTINWLSSTAKRITAPIKRGALQ